MQSRAHRGLLGGMTPRRFLAQHWQKRPLLVRRAVPEFAGMLSARELMQLASRDDAQSRVVTRTGRRWDVQHGPFRPASFRRIQADAWTLLVQDVNHFLPRARELLQRFDFVPYARLDDVMVSYAPPGGGVGPHFDSYDVFLVQGAGRRRWRIGAQTDLTLVPDAPLKLLARFRHDEEHVLEPGDMLYLPPGYAHDGVALDPCMTYSVGFRAPAWQELAAQFLYHLQDQVQLDGRYRDPGLVPAARPARLPPEMVRSTFEQLKRVRWHEADVRRFLGCYLTEPKAHAFFTRPQAPLSRAVFCRQAQRKGVALDLRTQMLHAGRLVFVNGECLDVGSCAGALRELADQRHLPPEQVDDRALCDLLYGWYLTGQLHLGTDTARKSPPRLAATAPETSDR
jgi:50S ribosomal protein L16 3-hydroxylase